MNEAIAAIKSLPIWRGKCHLEPLCGGLTNVNYLVRDDAGEFVVRLGEDIHEHHVMRFNELSASKAAHAAGISPKVIYAEQGIMVLDYIASKTFSPANMRQPENLEPVLNLMRRCHFEVPKFLRGPVLAFSVFHVIRDYTWTLKEGGSEHLHRLEELQKKAARLEKAQEHSSPVFAHNDWVAANVLDDGNRLWLIDWDYAGFNTALFDLANLASNNGFDSVTEKAMLETYFGNAPGDVRWQAYMAIKCASLLREAMWSMVSQIHSKIDHDFLSYSLENLERFENAYHLFVDLER